MFEAFEAVFGLKHRIEVVEHGAHGTGFVGEVTFRHARFGRTKHAFARAVKRFGEHGDYAHSGEAANFSFLKKLLEGWVRWRLAVFEELFVGTRYFNVAGSRDFFLFGELLFESVQRFLGLDVLLERVANKVGKLGFVDAVRCFLWTRLSIFFSCHAVYFFVPFYSIPCENKPQFGLEARWKRFTTR